MTLTTLQKILNSKKRGQFLPITYRKPLGDYEKTTTTIVRLVDYNNVKAVKEMKKAKGIDLNQNTTTMPKKPSADKHLGNNIIYNENTGKTRLQVFPVNNHKPHCIYTYQGNEIDKDTYYAESGDKQSNPSIVYSINIENIIAIG